MLIFLLLVSLSDHCNCYNYGKITYIKYGTPVFFSPTRGQIPCITRGGPPTGSIWRYNGQEVFRRNRVSRRGFTASIMISNSSTEASESSSYTSTLTLSGYFPGVFEYLVSNRAMNRYISADKLYIQGEPPTRLKAVLVGSERVKVSWTPPRIPPGNGYSITFDNILGSTVTVATSQTSHTIAIPPGVHSIEVQSLSQHYPGRTATLDKILVAGLYAEPSITSAGVSWAYSNQKIYSNIKLSRVIGPGQEICPHFDHVISLRTPKSSIVVKNLEEFSNYTAVLSSDVIPSINITFATLSGAPTSAPRKRTHTVTSTSMKVQWEPINCIHLNGKFLGYEVQLTRANGTAIYTRTVTEEVYNASGLNPATEYEFSVAVKNSEGVGPFSSVIKFLTNEAVPGVVTNITVDLIDSFYVVVNWRPPLEFNGALIAYELAFTLNGQMNRTNVSNTTYIFQQLGYGSVVYNFSVRAYTSVGPGAIARNSSVIRIILDPSDVIPVIVPDVRLTHIPETTSVRVEWDRIDGPGLTNYAVYFGSEPESEPLVVTVPSSQTYVVITDLNVDQEYKVQVVAISEVNTFVFTGYHAMDSSVHVPCEGCLTIVSPAVFAIIFLIVPIMLFVGAVQFYVHRDKVKELFEACSIMMDSDISSEDSEASDISSIEENSIMGSELFTQGEG